MGFHSDNEPSLGSHPTIASLSYGATRTLIFKHKRRKDIPIKTLKLTTGSLLLMKGTTQRNWNHGINKEASPCGPRINLTFRNIVG
jgi:alkylated DNA repair dioxygenase AlkB